MFFLKTKESKKNGVDFSYFEEKLGFWEYVHFDKKKPIADKVKDGNVEDIKGAQQIIYNMADAAASSIASLAGAGYLRKAALKTALQFCEQSLENRGYKQITTKEALELHDNDRLTIMLILGCQNPDQIKQRCRKAAEVVFRVSRNYRLVYSGFNPAEYRGISATTFKSEARKMMLLFENFIADFTNQRDAVYPYILDEKPENTVMNIKNLFTEDILHPQKTNDIFAVSSTYHLLRIDDAIQISINNYNPQNVGDILLIGSENSYHPEIVASTPRYVKQLFFEVYKELLSVQGKVPLVIPKKEI